MLLSREELQKMSPIEAEYVYAYIYELYHKKITEKTTNYENLNACVSCCPRCGSTHVIKWGYNRGKKTLKQRYLCKCCKKTFVPAAGTIFGYSNTSYHEWIDFIACEINGLTLNEEVIAISKSKTTCFNMRHKLYDALSDIQDNVVLSGEIELDPTYEKINLKGTKPENMPRISKVRGKSQKSSMLICDKKSCLRQFANENGMTTEVIPSTGFKSTNGKTLADINQLHQLLSILNKRKHGVSTRHLPVYLDWLLFCKQLK